MKTSEKSLSAGLAADGNDTTAVSDQRQAVRVNGGGPAFPVLDVRQEWNQYDQEWGGVHTIGSPGMTLRDYFAARAPKHPQDWFQPVMAAEKPAPIYECSGTAEHDIDGKCWDPYECCEANFKERSAWDREQEKQRLIQWPYAWADAMLIARQAGKESR